MLGLLKALERLMLKELERLMLPQFGLWMGWLAEQQADHLLSQDAQ